MNLFVNVSLIFTKVLVLVNCNSGVYECQDINECEQMSHDCSAREDCENTLGSYTCSCKTGFQSTSSIDCGTRNDPFLALAQKSGIFRELEMRNNPM